MRISCYLEHLYPFKPVTNIDLIFTRSDSSKIRVKLLRLKMACVCIPVWQLNSRNLEVVRGGWRRWIEADL